MTEVNIRNQLAATPLAPFPYGDDVPAEKTRVPLDNQPLVDVEDR